MKRISFKRIYLAFAVISLLGAACSGSDDFLQEQLSGQQQGGENITRAEAVEATVELTETLRLSDALVAQGIDDTSKLQDLTIKGVCYYEDLIRIKDFTQLRKLDMGDAETKASYVDRLDGAGTTYQDWMSDNVIIDQMCYYLKQLETFVFPIGVETIGYNAFEGCESLKDIVIPNTVTRIAGVAFWGCSSLTSIEIPASVTQLEWGAFYNCTSLVTAKVYAKITYIEYQMFYGCSNLQNVELSDEITSIREWAFSGCSSLTDFSQFANITVIGRGSFEGCGFTTVDLSNIQSFGTETGGGYEDIFQSCKSLTTVVLPNTMTEIPNGFLNDCSSLTDIALPDGVTVIGNHAFRNCESLANIDLPEAVTSIGNEAFSGCHSLTNISLPASLERIGSLAFFYSALAAIEIPNTVTFIGERAFSETSLETLTVPASVKETTGPLTTDCNNLKVIFWNSSAEVYDRKGGNKACYLYLDGDGAQVGYGPNWVNVVVDGVAESVVLYSPSGNYDRSRAYYCPRAYKAKKIFYTTRFNETGWETGMGESGGWQPLVLPFTPTRIYTKENGDLAPFNSNVSGAKPFWLRELTAIGFVDVTTMEPGVPYIVAMPYHTGYYDPQYNIRGEVTFEGENVEIAATPDELPIVEGPDFYLQPTYKFIQCSSDVYALNYEYWVDGYRYGSVFAANTQDVYPFEAYVVSKSGAQLLEISTQSANTRASSQKNITGIPQIGDM